MFLKIRLLAESLKEGIFKLSFRLFPSSRPRKTDLSPVSFLEKDEGFSSKWEGKGLFSLNNADKMSRDFLKL